MLENIDFDEAKQSQLPMVELLINMGYEYIPCEETLKQRGEDTGKFLLGDVARESLMRINGYEHDGKKLKFSELDVAKVVDELENTRLEGLIPTSKEIFNTIMPKLGGKTVEVYHDGRYENRSFRFIDFDNPENNSYHVTVEYKVTGRENIRPDIVCFVNGIPLVVIENKKSSVKINKAVDKLRRYQLPEYCPKLFIYTQLLIAANSPKFLYGTTGTPAKFFAGWREKDQDDNAEDGEISRLISKKINQDVYAKILKDLNGYTAGRKQKLVRDVKPQDRGTYGMLRPERLLDIVRNYVFYDGIEKKVARYQQYFAIHKMLDRVHELEQDGKKRRGGVVWHTQGSGKSLSMVMFVRELIEDPEIVNPRVVIVTDRKDLDRQIKATFKNAGLKKQVKQARSGEHLLKLIRDKDSAVITTLVHKFGSASKKRADFSDPDKNIFVLVDEAHRSHSNVSGKEASISASFEMMKTIPNACYIAFTGTPLLKNEKTRNKFGDFIDTYTIDDALKDKIILPLIYEGRYVPLYQDKKQIDRKADRVTEDLSAKNKYIAQSKAELRVPENPDRVEEICQDVQKHYTHRFQGTGLKAQLVAPSKPAALIAKKFFDREGKIKTALVISDEDGDINEEDMRRQEVAEFLKKVKADHLSLQKYEEAVIEDFKNNPEGVEILIVVDKLLTGFDAPRNTVLYLAKQLKDHNLLQAIARVNRLYENPAYPKTSGFIIDYSENAQNIKDAMDLFGNYEPDDVKLALTDVHEKIDELQKVYGELTDIFKGVPKDDQALLEFLKDDPTRRTFEEKINEFVNVFSECLSLKEFVDKFDDKKLRLYQNEAKKFHNLKKSAALQYGEEVDLRKYQLELVRILDENIKAEEAQVLTGEIEITNRETLREAIEELGSTKSKAEAIAAQTQRRITERKEQDEVLYTKFSKRIEEILQAMHKKKLADIDALKQLQLIDDEVEQKKDSDLPEAVKQNLGAGIFYRNLRELVPVKDYGLYEKISLEIDSIVKRYATVDWWRNFEAKRRMRSKLDDYLYDTVKVKFGIELDYTEIDKIIERTIELAENNHNIFDKK